MDILSCTPFNTAFSKVQCCVCGKEMKINSRLSYTITKSGLFLCLEHYRKRNPICGQKLIKDPE